MKKTGWYILFICLLVPGLLAGCGRTKKIVSPLEEIEQVGVLDLQQAVKAHHRWGEIAEIDAQIELLRKQGKSVIQTGEAENSLLLEQHRLSLEKQQEEWNREREQAEAEVAASMEAKKALLQQQIAEKVQTTETEKMKQLGDYQEKLQAEYTPKLLNLQLKIKYTDLSSDQRAEKIEQMENLRQEQQNKLKVRQDALLAELQTEVKGYQQKMEKELRDYHGAEEKKIAEKMAGKRELFLESSTETQGKVQENQQKLQENKTAEIQALEKKADLLNKKKEEILIAIRSDLKKIAGQIANKEKLTAILVNYQAIGNAQDITAQVMEQCN